MMEFGEARWLWLLPLVLLAGLGIPRLGIFRNPLRAVWVLVFLVWLANPRANFGTAGMDLWVLLDRSDSAAEAMASARPELERILEFERGGDDRLFLVDYASAPVLREAGTNFEPPTGATKTALAVNFALGLRDPNRDSRVLLISDGESTDDMSGLAVALAEADVPLDLRILPSPSGDDYRLGKIDAPARVAPGQAFVMTVPVYGPADGPISYRVTRDGEPSGSGTVQLQGGRAVLRLAARAGMAGASQFEVRVLPDSDIRPGNDSSSHWVEASSGGSVLLLSPYPDDPLRSVLEAAGIDVQTLEDPSDAHPGMLTGPRAVVLNNIGADELSPDFFSALDFFVREQGGGLLMTGGRRSYGSGGYFASAIDELLPVSMELRTEHRKLAVAMALVLDRSGSMAAGAGGGLTKMALANEGAARAVTLLGPSDAITAFAVDSEPHEVVPLTAVGSDALRIAEALRRVRSAGGGIYVYAGLEAAWNELKKSPAGQKHVVLFSDAADSEEPGDYVRLLEEMEEAGATVSVIALGTEEDPDADLLKDIAMRGGGRIFFNADAAELPALFAQETVSVARSAFLDEPVEVVDAGGWLELGGSTIEWPPAVEGYNLSYLRDGATAAAISGDEYKAPLVAFWMRGVGRVATVAFPVAGEDSGMFQQWPEAAGFLQTLTKWILPGDPPPGTALRTDFAGSDLLLEFLHDPQRADEFAVRPPGLVVADDQGRGRELLWQITSPGRHVAKIPVPPDGSVRGVVGLPSGRISFGPLSPGINPEWSPDLRVRAALAAASDASGGRNLRDLRDAWTPGKQQINNSLRDPLLGFLLILFLAEVGITRWRK
jgi:hypothetical protein